MLTIDLIIATIGPEGIDRVAGMLLPRAEGIRYIVSWQMSQGRGLPDEIASRSDVEVHRLEGRGLSRNRNNALDHSRGDIRLIADDDLVYTPGQLRAVAATFEQHPDLDVACFRYDGADGKQYPAYECDLVPAPKGYYITSFEMALRNRGAAARLRYDERFGLGDGPLTLGEEDELLYRIGRERLNARFFPITITTHAGLTSGSRQITDPRALKAQGAVIALNYPLTWPLRVPLKAWRNYRRGIAKFRQGLANGFKGAVWRVFRY